MPDHYLLHTSLILLALGTPPLAHADMYGEQRIHRIDTHLDRKGERINAHLDRRAASAVAQDRDRLAQRELQH